MEAENPLHFATTKATSWRVVYGSLNDAITCESSLSAVDSDADPLCRKAPLVLRRPLPDFGPCEIKITFEQKHEVKQVYVKSTARVYEIYYAASQQDVNEYLCTVRCGVAAKNADPLEASHAMTLLETDCSKTESVCPSGSTKYLDEGEVKTDSGSSTNEDGWVEVKDLKCAVLEDGDESLSGKIQVLTQRENQDFYEATAEISDGNPCTSILLRLLSVQSGESIYIEEVYVFADPVLCDDEDSTPTPRAIESASSSYMMSMLVPTLLQLSNSRTSQPLSLGCTSDKVQKDATPSSVNELGSISETPGAAPCLPTQEVPTQPSSKVENPGSHEIRHSVNNIENKLDQLYMRVTKMEEFFSRFEDKMLNPITCIEMRLQKVEQHLEELVNKTSSLPPNCLGTRIAAPDFCNASESQSSYNDEKGSSYLKEYDCRVEEVPCTLSDKSRTAGECHLVPSLIVTAPEFVCADDEDDNEVNETVLVSPKDIPRKHASINDALASALAGFLSSSLPQDQATACVREVSNTDFSIDNSNSDQEVFLSAKCDDSAGGSAHLNKTSEINGEDIVDVGNHEPPVGNGSGESTESISELDGQYPENHIDSVVEDHFNSAEPPVGNGSGESTESISELDGQYPENHIDSLVDDHFNSADNRSMNESTVTVEKIDECVIESVDLDHARDPISMLDNGLNDMSDIARKATGNKPVSISGEQVRGNSFRMPLDIFELPTSSSIDYKTPILDVQFAKQGDPLHIFSSLEALLSDDSKLGHENMCSHEEAVEKISDATYLVEVQENKSVSPGATLVDLGADESRKLSPSNDEALQVSCDHKEQTMSMALL